MQAEDNGMVRFEYRSELDDIQNALSLALSSGKLSDSQKRTVKELNGILDAMWYSW
jgi:hypothetical protein